MLAELLAADPGYRGPRVDCGEGHQAVFTGYRPKVADTVLGPVRLRRAWYHCAGCRHGLAPRDGELGVAGTSMSPGLAAMTSRAGAAVPFARAAGLLRELAGVRLTVKRVERSAEASGTALAAASRSRARLVKAEGIRRGAEHVRQMTIIGDGAAWIWNLAAATFPEATQIVDLYHARVHLHDLAHTLEFMLLDHKAEWLAARLDDLDYGYIDGITASPYITVAHPLRWWWHRNV